MTNGSIRTNGGKSIEIYRTFTKNSDLSSTQYTAPSRMQFNIENITPSIADTSIPNPIPVSYGTPIDGGDNNFTGSSGGDNSTDNTSTYKDGAGITDVTAQNLIANSSNASKIWTLTLTTYPDELQYTGLWLYIKDSTALAKFLTSGTCLEIKLGSDSSNYFSKTYEANDLSTGWNWLPLGILGNLTETGTVSGNIDTFIILITTNNSTDTFVAGDVVYDLLRQWELSNTYKDMTADYPVFDFTNNVAQLRFDLTTLDANGFDINGDGIWNDDTSPILESEDTFTAESKGLNDEFGFIIKNR